MNNDRNAKEQGKQRQKGTIQRIMWGIILKDGYNIKNIYSGRILQCPQSDERGRTGLIKITVIKAVKRPVQKIQELNCGIHKAVLICKSRV